MIYSKGLFNKVVGIISEEERIVGGYFTDDKVDEYGHMFSREAMERAIEEYREWANVRDMHNRPVGKAVRIGEPEWNYLEVKVVDDEVWELVRNGVYNGFSVGVLVTGISLVPLDEVEEEKFVGVSEATREMVEEFGFVVRIDKCALVEISLVDRPANPRARFAELSLGLDGDVEELMSVKEMAKFADMVKSIGDVFGEEEEEEIVEEQRAMDEDEEEDEGDEDKAMMVAMMEKMDTCIAMIESLSESLARIEDALSSAQENDAPIDVDAFIDAVSNAVVTKMKAARVGRRPVNADEQEKRVPADARGIAMAFVKALSGNM